MGARNRMTLIAPPSLSTSSRTSRVARGRAPRMYHQPRSSMTEDAPGRPRRGVEGTRQPSRLQRQLRMDRDAVIDELSKAPAVGSKKNAKGFVETWSG